MAVRALHFMFPGIQNVGCLFQMRTPAYEDPSEGTIVFRDNVDQEAVLKNREDLLSLTGVSSFAEVHQVHGDKIVFEPSCSRVDEKATLEADGLATQKSGLALMVMWWFIVRKDNYNDTITFNRKEVIRILLDSTPAFLMPVLLLGGIRFGIFTPTEGGAFAAIYAIVVCMGYYRELSLRQLIRVSASAARTTAVVMFIVATASAVGFFITIAQIPQQVVEFFRPLIDSPKLLLCAIMVFMLFMGMVMDLTPNILIFAPVFYPLIYEAGIDPYYFGLLFILNLGIGVITPPVGTVLYVVSGIGGIKFSYLVKKLMPFMLVEIGMLFLLLFFPDLSLVPLSWLM